MKKIIKLFILGIICILPVMANAKANFELEAELDNKLLLEAADGKYTFVDENYDMTQTGSVVVFNSKGEKIEEDSLIPENNDDMDALFNSSYAKNYMKLVYDIDGYTLMFDDTCIYGIEYYNERINFENYVTSETGEFSFNDNLKLTKKILGKKYDVFLKLKKFDFTVGLIREYNGFFVVYYFKDNGDYVDYVSIMDSNYNIIKTIEGYEIYNYAYYVYDNLIYILKNNKDIEIYKLDGTLYQTYKIENDRIDDFKPAKILIENNKMFILFMPRYIPKSYESRIVSYDAEDLVKGYDSSFITLVYNLNFEVEKAETSNGDFTYESKFDEKGREYVELKISPLKGYSVEDIIVTDINGKRIDVTNNKFYMPTSDVRVEVKFGEYIPIPDTFSEMSPIIKILAVLLIGCGMCTMYFSLKSKKIIKSN